MRADNPVRYTWKGKPITGAGVAKLELWYDYEVQAWVENGKYIACGHPASMANCCYAGSHAGETADPSHCLEGGK